MGILHDLIYGAEAGTIWRADTLTPPAAGEGPPSIPTATGAELPGSLLAQIDDAVAARLASFGLADALQIPSVIRAVSLLCSTVAQFAPVAYRDDVQMPVQPRVLRRPSPFGTRYEFLYGTMYALLAGDVNRSKPGNAFWLITDRDTDGQARIVMQLANGEIQVEWDDRRFLPIYRWRGRTLRATGPDLELIHIAIDRPPGALLGRSPIDAGLPALASIVAAEDYASAWFLTSGVPSVVLRTKDEKTREEADALKLQWLEAHSAPGPTPAVLSGGIEDSYPDVDPQGAQLQQTRDYGNTVVARLLGIPAPLLHVATSGSTITYTNTAAALEELVRVTLAPTYMPPIEAALSDLVPSTQSARLDTRDLMRVDIAARFALYGSAITAGIFGAEDARAFEGWPRTGPISGQLYAPTPVAPAAPSIARVPVP